MYTVSVARKAPRNTKNPDVARQPVNEAVEIVREYITGGQITHVELMEKRLKRLDEILAPEDRQGRIRDLLRVMVLPMEQIEALKRGETIRLEPRRYSSWTTSPHAAREIRAAKYGLGQDDQVVVILKEPRPENVVINVPRFYENHDLLDSQEWRSYVQWEQEVIIRNDDYYLTVAPEDVWTTGRV
jgi:hypothetical protein